MVSARKTCRKTRFATEFEAVKWLRRMKHHISKGVPIGRIPQRVYECDICDGYHATSRRYRKV